METYIQALVISFREGLEAFLIVAILLEFLDKTKNGFLKKNVRYGVIGGVVVSVILGGALVALSSFIGGTETASKLWESIASLVAVILITTFIVRMIQHGSKIKDYIENKAALRLSAQGILLLALFMVAREGAEIAIFAFAGKYAALPIVIGILLALGLAVLVYYSLVRVKLKTIFAITLAYLILQSGLLLGYGVHEGLSAFKSLEIVDGSSPIFTKAFDVSETIWNHKEGAIGVPLYVLLGWYSKPEWIQFILQYTYTVLLFMFWYKKSR